MLPLSNRERHGGAIGVNGDPGIATVTRQAVVSTDCGSTLLEVLILGNEGG